MRRSFFGSTSVLAWVALLGFAGCSGKGGPSASPRGTPASAAPAVAAPPASAASLAAGGASSSPGPVVPSSAGSAEPAAHEDGADLIAPALTLFRVAACGESGEVPARFDRALVDAHCKALRALYDRYRTRWLALAGPFIAGLRPSGLPPRVVYPFGGGDLLGALAV
jgi:hypothetical protein